MLHVVRVPISSVKNITDRQSGNGVIKGNGNVLKCFTDPAL